MNHNVAAAILFGLAAGQLKYPAHITQRNRLHTGRAPRGSAEEARAISEAEAKRARKNAKRMRSFGTGK